MKHELLSELGQYLIEGSLSDVRVLKKTGHEPPLPILPKANIIKIGGQSFIDRGRAAVFPLIEEIVANLGRHDMIIGTGGGSRARLIQCRRKVHVSNLCSTIVCPIIRSPTMTARQSTSAVRRSQPRMRPVRSPMISGRVLRQGPHVSHSLRPPLNVSMALT
jgi:hypothetical protein